MMDGTSFENNYASRAHRIKPADSLDDYPTPRWATRALCQHVIGDEPFERLTYWEPACGRGTMTRPLGEYFGSVCGSDIHDYGAGFEVADFLTAEERPVDWIVSNPPFKQAEEFALRGLAIACRGVALLGRSVFIEGIGRHQRLYQPHPPAEIAQYVERVPMVRGRLDIKARTATSYAWVIWRHRHRAPTELRWILTCRRDLERPGDYELSPPKKELT